MSTLMKPRFFDFIKITKTTRDRVAFLSTLLFFALTFLGSPAFANKDVALYIFAGDTEPSWDVEKDFNDWAARVRKGNPNIQQVTFLRVENREKLKTSLEQYRNHLKPGQKISDFLLLAHGNSTEHEEGSNKPHMLMIGTGSSGLVPRNLPAHVPDYRSEIIFSEKVPTLSPLSNKEKIRSFFYTNPKRQAKQTIIEAQGGNWLSPLRGQFRPGAHVFFKSCNLASGSKEIARRKMNMLVSALDLPPESRVFAASEPLPAPLKEEIRPLEQYFIRQRANEFLPSGLATPITNTIIHLLGKKRVLRQTKDSVTAAGWEAVVGQDGKIQKMIRTHMAHSYDNFTRTNSLAGSASKLRSTLLSLRQDSQRQAVFDTNAGAAGSSSSNALDDEHYAKIRHDLFNSGMSH